MFWEELTAQGFTDAAGATGGVCLIPLSCIEGHGPHLPLATDMYIGRELCRRATLIEPALIFPDLIFTQIIEARHTPGTIAIPISLSIALCEAIFAECARNGLHKIILVNAHGGNRYLAGLLTQMQLERQHDYTLYLWQPQPEAQDVAALALQWDSTLDGHAGESETSQMLAIHPNLVSLDLLGDPSEGMPRGRLAAIADAGLLTGIWWFADFPNQYCGDGAHGAREKGEALLMSEAHELSRVIRLVREDQSTRALQDEFFARSYRPSG